MPSPAENKMSMFPQSIWGTPNIAANGRGYMTTDDGGWAPMTGHIQSGGMRSGMQAPLARTIKKVTKGEEGTYNKHLELTGDELWWLDSVGDHGASPVASGPPQTTPPTFTKTYESVAKGPSGFVTIVQDRFKFGNPDDFLRTVYDSCMVKSFGLAVSMNNPWTLATSFVSRLATRSDESAPVTAAYAAQTGDEEPPFAWDETQVFVGDAGTLAGSFIGFLHSLKYDQNNNLKVERQYIDGDANMAQPFTMGTITGSLGLEFDLHESIKTGVIDKFYEGNHISVQAVATRGVYKFILWLPDVFLSNVTEVSSMTDATMVSATGELRYNESNTDPAVRVSMITEGSSNP